MAMLEGINDRTRKGINANSRYVITTCNNRLIGSVAIISIFQAKAKNSRRRSQPQEITIVDASDEEPAEEETDYDLEKLLLQKRQEMCETDNRTLTDGEGMMMSHVSPSNQLSIYLTNECCAAHRYECRDSKIGEAQADHW